MIQRSLKINGIQNVVILTEKDVRNNGEQGEKELAGHSPGVQGGGHRQGHHKHHHDALPGDGGGGASWQLEGGDRGRVRDAQRERDDRLPDTRRTEEGSVDHLPGRVVHHHGHGGAGAGARGGAVQTWKEKSSKLYLKNDAGNKIERGPPQTADTDRSSSITTFPPISSNEGRQSEEEGRYQVKKTEVEIEERRQESRRRSGFNTSFQSTNICITRLSKSITYRGGGETETARGSRKPSCGSSSSSASPQDPQSPTSSSTLVEQATRSPLIDRRSPSPVELMAGRTMSADKCRNTFQLSGNTKTTEAAAMYEGNNTLGGKMQ